jgi:HD-GYP domain-containing protein (c-di-GMP phosphodiesterase class II)
VLQDIRLETVLVETEFLDSVGMGLIIQGKNGEVIDHNLTARQLLGITQEGLMNFHFGSPIDIIREDGSPFPVEERPVAITLRTGEQFKQVVMGIESPGQALRWLIVDTWPLIVEGEVAAVISVFDDYTDRWKKRHLLELLSEVMREVAFATDEQSSLRQLCDALVEHGPYALAWVGTPSSSEESGIDVVCASGKTDYLDGLSISWSGSKDSGRGPIGTAMRTGATQVVNDLTQDSMFERWRARAEMFELASLIAIPLKLDGRRAVLGVYDRHIYAFDQSGISGLEDIMQQVEFGIEHVRSVARLGHALNGTLAALGQMTDTRDPYTAGHQSHVGRLSEAIATRLGLDSHMGTLIRQSGEVHDIGKIAVPSEILTRPGRLSKLEFEMVKLHTIVGWEILEKASLPWPIAEVALQHHERMDGSGYPSGLTAGKIILPARIIGVADVVEAMTQHRPYRPGLGLDRALSEIRSGAGVLYDTDVVDACLAVFEEGFEFAQVSELPKGGTFPN